MENKYFKVTCKCGHVGIKYYIRIPFAVKATSRKGAAEIARYIPRVKHDHKDAILECIEITYAEYLELKEKNRKDPYLCCKCKQEQEMIKDFSKRLEIEPRFLKEKKKTKRNSVIYRVKKQIIKESEKWWLAEEEDEGDYLYEQFTY